MWAVKCVDILFIIKYISKLPMIFCLKTITIKVITHSKQLERYINRVIPCVYAKIPFKV
jgi:hypothetical protein